MYRVVLEVGKAGVTEQVNLFESDDFDQAVSKAWDLCHVKGCPASQVDILRSDDGQNWLSVWADFPPIGGEVDHG